MSHTLCRIAFSVKLWYQLREAYDLVRTPNLYDLVRTPHRKGVGIWAHIWGEEKGLRIGSYGFLAQFRCLRNDGYMVLYNSF